jgi:16S rRNA (guanine527-N7)-methyltransferase
LATSLSQDDIARELADYGVFLAPGAVEKLAHYLELLLRWNRRVNLTGIRQPRQMVRRLFGESLFLASVVRLRGWLVDIGSGAGFPGLALKLVAPELRVTLLEARQRKCAFLKQVARECRFSTVDVVDERFEDWAATVVGKNGPDFYTTRAVKVSPRFLALLGATLAPRGQAVFLTSKALAAKIRSLGRGWRWEEPIAIPPNGESIALAGSVDCQLCL